MQRSGARLPFRTLQTRRRVFLRHRRTPQQQSNKLTRHVDLEPLPMRLRCTRYLFLPHPRIMPLPTASRSDFQGRSQPAGSLSALRLTCRSLRTRESFSIAFIGVTLSNFPAFHLRDLNLPGKLSLPIRLLSARAIFRQPLTAKFSFFCSSGGSSTRISCSWSS